MGKLPKITENSRNLPENSLKNPKILSPRKGMAARGCNTFGFQVSLIVTSNSSLESYWVGDQMLSLKQV